jgi:hypothetical protein
MDAAVERTGMYSPRVQKAYADQRPHSLVSARNGVNQPRRTRMRKLSPEEEQKILNSPPKGTFALLLLVGALIFAGWIYMFFYMFLEHGPVK